MLVLALDTTTRAGSVALARDGKLLEVVVGDAARPHASRLPGELLDLLARQRLGLDAVDLFAVAAGPGSFTGLRIGIATVQGLAFANERLIAPISALDALAEAVCRAPAQPPGMGEPLPLVAAWMDAQRHEVFSALYDLTPTSDGGVGWTPIDEPAVACAEPTLARWAPRVGARRVMFVGDGAIAYRDLITGQWGEHTLFRLPTPALAPAVASLARVCALEGKTVQPHAVRPIYVRRPDAELTRDRQRAAAEGTSS
jgi:tRNA threonylcarbamoyladenosine biosynthesis protein TsaB